jgi:hypothetical protein
LNFIGKKCKKEGKYKMAILSEETFINELESMIANQERMTVKTILKRELNELHKQNMESFYGKLTNWIYSKLKELDNLPKTSKKGKIMKIVFKKISKNGEKFYSIYDIIDGEKFNGHIFFVNTVTCALTKEILYDSYKFVISLNDYIYEFKYISPLPQDEYVRVLSQVKDAKEKLKELDKESWEGTFEVEI